MRVMHGRVITDDDPSDLQHDDDDNNCWISTSEILRDEDDVFVVNLFYK